MTTEAPQETIETVCGHCGGTHRKLNPAYIKWRRESLGLTIRVMAARCGVSIGFINDVERGRRRYSERLEAGYGIKAKRSAA